MTNVMRDCLRTLTEGDMPAAMRGALDDRKAREMAERLRLLYVSCSCSCSCCAHHCSASVKRA